MLPIETAILLDTKYGSRRTSITVNLWSATFQQMAILVGHELDRIGEHITRIVVLIVAAPVIGGFTKGEMSLEAILNLLDRMDHRVSGGTKRQRYSLAIDVLSRW